MAASDPRIRVLQTSQNSGGAGAPRNIGIRAARAPWLTFLDSDDTMDRHACKNLLRAAERDDSDITAGKTIRVHLDTGRQAGWHARLYTEKRHLKSISEFVELAIDTNSTAKLYRRQFIIDEEIYFPEQMHYEDLVFTAQAYKFASGISIIPERVYDWKIYSSSVRKSITHQRDNDVNLGYRLAALDRIDELVGGPGDEALYDRLQLKFLRHDARIYLNDIPRMSRQRALITLEQLQPRLRSTSRHVYTLLSDMERFLCGAALLRSPRGVAETLRAINGQTTLDGQTVQDGNETIWLPSDVEPIAPEKGSLERKLLDVTGHAILDTPFPVIKFGHHATNARKRAGAVVVSGETADPYGKLHVNLESLSGFVRITLRGNGYAFDAPLTIRPKNRQRVAWSFSIRMPDDVPFGRPHRFDFKIHLNRAGSSNSSSILYRLPRSVRPRAQAPGVRGRFLRQRYFLYGTQAGRFAMRLTKARGKRGQLETVLIDTVRRGRNLSKPRISTIKPESLIGRSLYRAFRTLPLNGKKALFESHMGKSGQDSPRKVADALAAQHVGIRHVWSVNSMSIETPETSAKTRRHSLGYLWHLATAKYLVDNQSLPSYFVKRTGQTYLQTWHGTPLKKMGFDVPEIQQDPEKRRQLTGKVAQWDFLTVPNEYFQDIFLPAFGYQGRQICYGSPRNDELVNHADSTPSLVSRLDLPKGKKVLLYAPTFRQSNQGRSTPVPLRLNLDEWASQMGDDFYLLIRPHYLNRITIPLRLRPYCMDVSTHDNINDLYLAADAIITDYSSVMFDYATLDRPIYIYAYDYDQYMTTERGAYFDLQQTPPGHFTQSQDELQSAIRNRWDDLESRSMLQMFKKLYCGTEPGDAAMKTVHQVWGPADV